MNQELINTIKSLKEDLKIEGFLIEGIFGSYSRNEQGEFSDIDILYSLDDSFYEKYRGFKAISKLDEINDYLNTKIGITVDLTERSSLGEIGKKYILSEIAYV